MGDMVSLLVIYSYIKSKIFHQLIVIDFLFTNQLNHSIKILIIFTN